MKFSFKKFTFSGNSLPKPKKVSGTGEFKTTPKSAGGGKTKVGKSPAPAKSKPAKPTKSSTPKTAKPPKPKKVKM